MPVSANSVLRTADTEHCDTPAMSRSTDRTAYTRCYDRELARLRAQANPTVASAPATTEEMSTFGMIFLGIGIVVLIGYTMMGSSKKGGKNNLKLGNRTNATKLNLKK